MFDVHYHLLWGVDDGPKSIDDSIALAEASIAEGVTHIVATPHANSRYEFNPVTNRERLRILNDRFAGRLSLSLGCDFHLSYENIEDLERDPSKYTIGGKQYLLVEFPDYAIPSSMSDVLFRFRCRDLVPVITHPERNPILSSDPKRLDEWIDGGCVVQVTAGSLCGDFGASTASNALDLVRSGRVHLVASDAHSVQSRPPAMRRAYEVLRCKFDQSTADRLCLSNPRAVFCGGDWPEPKVAPALRESRPGGLLSRLLRK